MTWVAEATCRHRRRGLRFVSKVAMTAIVVAGAGCGNGANGEGTAGDRTASTNVSAPGAADGSVPASPSTSASTAGAEPGAGEEASAAEDGPLKTEADFEEDAEKAIGPDSLDAQIEKLAAEIEADVP
ncbi:MAG: hypothetical protein AAGN82_02285 [Myxococcota bacterium]